MTEKESNEGAELAETQILDFTRIKKQYAGEVSSYAEKDLGY